jgi:hypothetical protein
MNELSDGVTAPFNTATKGRSGSILEIPGEMLMGLGSLRRLPRAAPTISLFSCSTTERYGETV